MTKLSENIGYLTKLKEDYSNLQWYNKYIFFPRRLRVALNNFTPTSNESAYKIYQALYDNPSRIERWLINGGWFTGIRRFFETPFAATLRKFREEKLLGGHFVRIDQAGIFDIAISHENPLYYTSAENKEKLEGFYLYHPIFKEGEHAQSNRAAYINCPQQGNFTTILANLQNTGLLTTSSAAQANFDAIAKHPDIAKFSEAINNIRRHFLIGNDAQTNFDTIAKHPNTAQLCDAILDLHGTGLLQDYFHEVVKFSHPINYARAISFLCGRGEITRENRAMVNSILLSLDSLPGIHGLMCTGKIAALLRSRLLFTEEYRSDWITAMQHSDCFRAGHALRLLRDGGLLTGAAAEANRNAVRDFAENISGVVPVIQALTRAHLLTQERFNQVIAHSAVLCHELWGYQAWELTAARWDEIIEIAARQDLTEAEIRNLIVRYFRAPRVPVLPIAAPLVPVEAQPLPQINNGQSTHTASVHASVSRSAHNLYERYQAQIATQALLDGVLATFSIWLMFQADDELKIPAARRCFQRITAITFTFTDPGSDVSIRQLIALVWIAIHDAEQTTEGLSENEIKQLLIDGLYEIQRGYNLSEEGVDNGSLSDIPICVGGTFNKLIEKLAGVHKDVEVIYLTRALATRKLPIVVQDEAIKYLRTLKGTLEANKFNPLIDKIAEEGLGYRDGELDICVWDKIKASVTDRIFDEFGSLYNSDKENAEFVAFINNGIYKDCEEAILPLKHDVVAGTGVGANPAAFFAGEAAAGAAALGTAAPSI
jgi:hypothetical protein